MSKLLCKMVPHSFAYGVPFGGQVELTQTDIAAGLSFLKLSDFEARYIRAAYLLAEPWGEKTELGRAAWDWAMDKAIAGRWEIPRGEYMVRRLSYVAVDSRINRTMFVCQSCQGVGAIISDGTKGVPAGVHRCNDCKGERTDEAGKKWGNGVKDVSDRAMGQLLGITDKTYKSKWEEKFHGLVSDLIEIESRVLRNLKHVIYGD